MQIEDRLAQVGIQASRQRVAVALYVLNTSDHPSADAVWAHAQLHDPGISRATVYNTLNAFAAKGLLRALAIAPGRVVFDPVTSPHHHFVDNDTGRIYDISWDQLSVMGLQSLAGFDVDAHQVVVHGRKRDALP